MKTGKKKIPERSRSVLGRFYCSYNNGRSISDSILCIPGNNVYTNIW